MQSKAGNPSSSGNRDGSRVTGVESGATLVEKVSGKVHRLDRSVSTIGRDKSCDIILLNDACVSRQHAVVAVIEDNFFVEDLGSTNGTTLNGKALSDRRQLFPGDKLIVGKTEMAFEMAVPETMLDHYQLAAQLGKGGMGVVYKAIDRRDGTLLAIKQLNFDGVDQSRHKYLRDRFKREATTAARLNHPNIVTVYGVETGRENCYYTMEFLEGRSLAREIQSRTGRLTPEEFLPILQQVCEGLSYAHSMRVVHRDVKPDNIFILADGRVKITDFGIAAVMDIEQTQMTLSGSLLGTPAYVSPEQIQDPKHVDHRADIFSLGVVTYEALSGKLPFAAEGLAALALQIINEDPPPLDEIAPGVSPATAAVVERALRKRPKDRYPSALDLLWDYKRSLLPDSAAARDARAGRQVTPVDTFLVPDLARSAAPAKAEAAGGRHTEDKPVQPVAEETQPSSPIVARLLRPIGIIGEAGPEGKLADPVSVACGVGRIAVADSSLKAVRLYASDLSWIANLNLPSEAEAHARSERHISNPSSVAIDSRGQIFVSDAGHNQVSVFDSEGNYLRQFAASESRDGGILGLACDRMGRIIASDVTGRCLRVLDADAGAIVATFGMDGIVLISPSWLAVDPESRIWAIDFGTSSIMVFASDGKVVSAVGLRAAVPGMFVMPTGLTVDDNGLIYVTDGLNNRLQVFSSAGDFLYSAGGTGSASGQFVQPMGLAFDPTTKSLFVGDRGNHRVQVFELKQH